MTSLEDFPQRSGSHDTSEAAETALRSAIQANSFFVLQGGDHQDYGSDFQLEARDGSSMTNFRAQIQLKGTKSPSLANGSVSVGVSRTNLNYLLSQPNSLYVCYHRPSSRLLVRYADDVLREYSQTGSEWTNQDQITVNFHQIFDENFQRRLNARLIASNKFFRDRRVRWNDTPPERIPSLIEREPKVVEVPVDAGRANKMLAELYEGGHDDVISSHFLQFQAVLGAEHDGMIFGYMSEVNLGINGISFDKDRVRQAINLFRLEMDRGKLHSGPLLYCIGNAFLALGEHYEARSAYRKALGKLGTPEFSAVAAQCCKNLGAALTGLNKMDEARRCYEQAIQLDPNLGEAHFAIALWHYRVGNNIHTALEHFDRIVRRGSSALQMSSVQGWRIELLFKSGDATSAFREINNLVSQVPRPNWVWSWCARHVAEFGNLSSESPQKALTFWHLYLDNHAGEKHAELERLLCLYSLRESGKQTGIDFNIFKASVLETMRGGDFDAALLWEKIGRWAQYDKNWVQAEQAYRNAYELNSERYGYDLGTALNFLGQYSESLSILLPLAESSSQDDMIWFQVAVALEGVGDFQGSVLAYQKALTINPNYALALFNLGGVYWNSIDKVRGKQIWIDAVARYPEHDLAARLRQDLPLMFEDENGE